MTPKVFSPAASRKAQVEYCRKNHAPHYAPIDGICFRCKKDIYQQNGIAGHTTGISLEEAGLKVIVYCPHCGRSYDD